MRMRCRHHMSYYPHVCVNWSFCQFSLAAITVVPPSSAERLVAIFVQLIGLVTMYPLIAACAWTIYKMYPFELSKK